jgi:hypothetical protein
VIKYWREPTVLRYKDGSSIGSPVNANKTEEEAIGDVIGFAYVILVLLSKSWIYLSWESRRPSFTGRTSIPRK